MIFTDLPDDILLILLCNSNNFIINRQMWKLYNDNRDYILDSNNSITCNEEYTRKYMVVKTNNQSDYENSGIIIIRFSSMVPPLSHPDRVNFKVEYEESPGKQLYRDACINLMKLQRIDHELYQKQCPITEEYRIEYFRKYGEYQRIMKENEKHKVIMTTDKKDRKTYVAIIEYAHCSCDDSHECSNRENLPWYDQMKPDWIGTEEEFLKLEKYPDEDFDLAKNTYMEKYEQNDWTPEELVEEEDSD